MLTDVCKAVKEGQVNCYLLNCLLVDDGLEKHSFIGVHF